MKSSCAITLGFAAAVALFASASAAPTFSHPEVAALAAQLEIGGGELLSEQVIRFKWLPGDNSEAALFSIAYRDGGTATYQYLAVFELVSVKPYDVKSAKRYRLAAFLQVGQTGLRYFKRISLTSTKGAIALDGASWSTADAMCCPTVSTHAEYRLRKGNLIESEQ